MIQDAQIVIGEGAHEGLTTADSVVRTLPATQTRTPCFSQPQLNVDLPLLGCVLSFFSPGEYRWFLTSTTTPLRATVRKSGKFAGLNSDGEVARFCRETHRIFRKN